MTKDEAMKFIADELRKALTEKFVGQPLDPEKIRAEVHNRFQEFVDALFQVHHIDFHEHINVEVVADEKDKSLLHISVTPKTKTGAAILLEWQRRGAL